MRSTESDLVETERETKNEQRNEEQESQSSPASFSL